MTRTTTKSWLLTLWIALALDACAASGNQSSRHMDLHTPTAAEGDTPMAGVDIAHDLVSLREEEKLARDVYRTLHDRWAIPAFANIAEPPPVPRTV
jgi:hypothetical protein